MPTNSLPLYVQPAEAKLNRPSIEKTEKKPSMALSLGQKAHRQREEQEKEREKQEQVCCQRENPDLKSVRHGRGRPKKEPSIVRSLAQKARREKERQEKDCLEEEKQELKDRLEREKQERREREKEQHRERQNEEKERREREQQEKEHHEREKKEKKCNSQATEKSCSRVGHTGFALQRAKERMELSQQQSRINESKQKVHKPKRQPSMVASLAQKKRRLMENQEKELRERTIVKEGVQVYQQDNATVNEQRYRTEQYAMKSQNTQCKKLRKTVQPLMQNKELINPVLDVVYGDQDTPCRRKRKITQPHILNEETTHSDNDAAFEDQMNVHAVERNMQIDSVCAVSNETDNEMSYPPLDVSSDEYSDYYYSLDDNVYSQSKDVPKAVKRGRRKAVGVDENGRNYVGKMDVQCPFCGALHWIDEKTSDSSFVNPKFSKCCHKGKVKLPALLEPPPALKELYKHSKYSRENIISYNAANAYTSLGCKYDTRAKKGRGPPSFLIHGELRHYSGSLIPEKEEEAIYSQLFLYDPSHALSIREKRN